MARHIHAELMVQYAQDAMRSDTPWKYWEMSVDSIEWYPLSNNPDFDEDYQYRWITPEELGELNDA